MKKTLIGRGILDAYEPEVYGEYGYGFLISKENQAEVEEYFTWWGDMRRKYSKGAAEKCLLHLLYDDLNATDEEVKDALEHQIAYRNYNSHPLDLGYRVIPWEKLRCIMDEMKRQEDAHCTNPDTGPDNDLEFSPFDVFTYQDFGAAVEELHRERYRSKTAKSRMAEIKEVCE